MKTYLISLILLLSFVTSNIMIHSLGSFTNLSFDSNDARINTAFKLLRDSILSQNKYKKITIIPISIYSQLVHGINYKVITAIKDEDNFKLNLSESTVFMPFDNLIKPTVQSNEIIEKNTNFTLDSSKNLELSTTINKYLQNLKSNLLEIVNVEFYPISNIDESYFILKARTSNSKSQKFIVSQSNVDQSYVVKANVSFNK